METSYKAFPSPENLAQIGAKILSGDIKNDSFKIILRPKSRRAMTCHIFAKHKDVVAILGPELSSHIDLSLYDKALYTGGGGAEFFISAKDKTEQWDLLSGALSITPDYDRNYQKYTRVSKPEQCPSRFIENQATIAVKRAIEIIKTASKRKEVDEETFRPVQDYGYLVTHLIVRDVVGLKMPGRPHPLYSLFRFVSWIKGNKGAVIDAPEIKQANELVFWIEVMFGQLFVNPGDHNKLILFSSQIISKKYRNVIRDSLENPLPGSLIDRMVRARPELALSDARFEELVINIVMELVGSFQYLTGRAFAGVYETIQTHFSASVEPGGDPLKVFNARMSQNPRAMIDEALRHNSPTGFIFRTAKHDFTYNNIFIESGDLLCVLCDQAVKDPSVFVGPQAFLDLEKAEAHQNDYLAFASPDTSPASMRPYEDHHPCFGQYWARSILEAMLIGLEELDASL